MTAPQTLIIDDNALNVEILATLLETSGLQTVFINTPAHLPKIMPQLLNLQVIFLDLELPNYDGFEVYKALKLDERLNAVPVIAYTVHISKIDHVRRAGFSGFLGKPLRPELFPNQLARILAGQPVWEV